MIASPASPYRDNRRGASYAEIMAGGPPHIIVRLSTKSPIEIGDFVSVFASLASQYEQFIRSDYPDLRAEAQIYVKEIRPGSIEADLIPLLMSIAAALQDSVAKVIIEQFVKKLGEKIGAYFKPGGRVEDASKSDLKDFLGSVQAIANDPDGESTIEAAVYEDGKKQIKAAFKFGTKEAQQAREQIESQQRELERTSGAEHQRVMMVFMQANIKNIDLGKRTGERVMIEVLSPKDFPLIYASDLAEQKIKHELREADENAFKKGFVVDVNVELRGGKPVAYRVTNLHQVIDLPD